MSIIIDTRQVIRFAVSLPVATAAGRVAVGRAVARGALNIKKDAQATVRDQDRHGRLRHYPRSISYDVDESNPARVSAEIGPDKGRKQGPLGNILEFGTSRHGPALPHLGPALDRESQQFDYWVGKAAHDAMVKALR